MSERKKRIPVVDEAAEETDRDDDGYVLDLDEPRDGLDEVFERAVAAVDREHGAAAPRRAPTEDEPAAAAADDAAELRDRLMRTMADFENFRKRSEREKETLRRYALFEPLRDFVAVVDNIERAAAASGSAEDLKAGLQLTIRQLEELLRRYGVEKVPAVGRPFDPAVHEAVAREESEGVEVPTVSKELQGGYLLHGRLLRPALVHVAMPPTDPAASEGSGGERAEVGD